MELTYDNFFCFLFLIWKSIVLVFVLLVLLSGQIKLSLYERYEHMFQVSIFLIIHKMVAVNKDCQETIKNI